MRQIVFFIFLLSCSAVFCAAMVDTLTVETCQEGNFAFGNDKTVCDKLTDSKIQHLPLEDQKEAMLAIFTSGLDLETMQTVLNAWNYRMPTGPAPKSVVEHEVTCKDDPSVNCIDNAWFVLGGIDNAYKRDQEIFVPKSGMVYVQFNYTLNHPKDKEPLPYDPCDGPFETYPIASSNSQNYCAYSFSHEGKHHNTLHLNSVLQDKDTKQLSYTKAASFSTFDATLNITNTITVDAKSWQQVGTCSYPCGDSTCTKPRYGCEYDHSYQYEQILTLPVSLNATVPELYPQDYILKVHDATSKPIITFTSQIPEYVLYFGKTSIHKSRIQYRPFYIYAPYNYLWINQTNESLTLSASTIILEENQTSIRFTLPKEQLGTCRLQILDPFMPYIIDCPENDERTYTAFINTTLDQSRYDADENISLEIQVIQEGSALTLPVYVTYANHTTEHYLEDGKVEIDLAHVPGESMVDVKYDGYKTRTQFHSYNSNRYWHFFWFGFSLFFVFIFYKAVTHVMLRRRL